MTRIRLYQDVHFGGRELATDESIENMQTYDFNDAVSSCIVDSGIWLLYQHAHFQGEVSLLTTGNYGSPNAMGISNDILSSVRKLPEPSGPTICLFEDSHFRGRMVVLRGAHSNLKMLNFNDKMSSAIVLNGSWAAYEHVDFRGKTWRLETARGVGDMLSDGSSGFADMAKLGVYPTPSPFDNDTVSSLKPL